MASMDSSLDQYLWEAVVKEEEWDLEWEPPEPKEDIHYMEEELENSQDLPCITMDGLVPDMELEVEEMAEYCLDSIPELQFPLKVEEPQEAWEWESEEEDIKPNGNPILIQDTFIGWSSKREEEEEEAEGLYLLQWLPWERPRSVAFVGAEGSRISSNQISNSLSDFHPFPHTSSNTLLTDIQPSFQSTWPQEHFHPNSSSSNYLDYNPNSHGSNSTSHNNFFDGHYQSLHNLDSPSSSLTGHFISTTVAASLQPNDFEQLLNISESTQGSSAHFNLSQEQDQPIHLHGPPYEPISAPQSIYSSSSGSSWNGQDSYTSGSQDSSLSQDEILEQIHRECAEIEERQSSASPPEPMQPSTSKSRIHQTRQRKEPYTKKLAKRSQAISLSPQSLGSPMTGEKKKELNRIAATKYREKKRMERESANVELKTLEGRNTELRTECSAMETEIKYLKGLIKEIESRTSAVR